MEEICGYDMEFVEELPDYLKCAICTLALKNPVQLPLCGHRFCRLCLENVKKHLQSDTADLLCPIDRSKINMKKVFDDKGIERVVMDLCVRCSRNAEGCSWTGELRNLQPHLDYKCSFEEKKKTSIIIKELQQRVESCENKLVEKDTEIEYMKKEFTETLGQLTKTLGELTKELKELKDELRSQKGKSMIASTGKKRKLSDSHSEGYPCSSQNKSDDDDDEDDDVDLLHGTLKESKKIVRESESESEEERERERERERAWEEEIREDVDRHVESESESEGDSEIERERERERQMELEEEEREEREREREREREMEGEMEAMERRDRINRGLLFSDSDEDSDLERDLASLRQRQRVRETESESERECESERGRESEEGNARLSDSDSDSDLD